MQRRALDTGSACEVNMVDGHLAYDGLLSKVASTRCCVPLLSTRACRGRGEGREDMERERYGGEGGTEER